MRVIRVGVIDEHGIFRRGVVSCLDEDPLVEVVFANDEGNGPDGLDVAVASPAVAEKQEFDCPVVVCGELYEAPVSKNAVHAVLPRSSLTPEQLVATVRAAAAGLRVGTDDLQGNGRQRLDQRSVEVLRLLSQGADTREISRSLRYSERTIKGLIQEIEREFGARTRAEAVAVGIRSGLI